MKSSEVIAVANYQCRIAENPLWNERDGKLYWEDIDTGRLFRVDHASLEHECFYEGPVIGGFTFQEDGTLLLFEADRIVRLDPETKKRTVLCEGIDPDMQRFNDVIADPEGRVFAGSIGQNDESGGLYRVERDGSIEVMWKGTGCSNGMGFSVDLRRFYWTCSTTNTIFVADYDRKRGSLENRRVFYTAPSSEGTPDGLTIDDRDLMITARWGGSSLLWMTPAAEIVGRIDFPVARVSSVSFGGPELDTLYVTTAGGRPDSEGPDGSLYRVRVEARGRPEFRSKILL